MKKIFIIAVLFAVACAGTSNQDKNADKQLVKNLEGTWEGSIYLDEEEIPTDYQFFKSTDGTSGKFVEISYLHEIDGDFDIRYYAYVCGEFAVKNGCLSLTYYPETTYAEPFDDDVFGDYVAALWEYYLEEDRTLLWDDQSQLADAVLETLEESWMDVCEGRNQEGNNFSNLTVTEDKMSFMAGESTWSFVRAEQEWFTGYPLEEE